MNKPPVNSLSLEMIQSLSQTLSQLEKDKCRGVILTSVCSGILNLFNLYLPHLTVLKILQGSAQNIQCRAGHPRNVQT